MTGMAPPLWRAALEAPAGAMPGLLEALEPLAQSVSVFEAAADERQETVRWRVELTLTEAPHRAALLRRLAAACRPLGFKPRRLVIEPIAEADWRLAVTAMQAPPVRVGRLLVHGAGHAPVPGTIPVRVEAGLAFGSGEHGTTRACLAAIDALAGRRARRVLDLGCGSAVLGIAAAKLLRALVVAVDNDPIAVRVAAANAGENGVAHRLAAAVSEGYAAPLVRRRAPYDLILANILADPLIGLAPKTARHVAAGGTVVLSGFIARDAGRVAAAHRRQGLRLLRTIGDGAWVALVLRQPGRSCCGKRAPCPHRPASQRSTRNISRLTRTAKKRNS